MVRSARTVTYAQSLLLLLIPHGGQRVARQNAWAGMPADAGRARDHREALAAVELTTAAHRVRAAQ